MIKMPRRANDLTGKMFGYLKVIDRDPSNKTAKNRNIYWLCQCLKCGNYASVRSDNLTSGRTKTCGRCGFKGEKM